MIYLRDADFQLYCGNAADELAHLESGSVDCCVTSPPYYAQRDYGTGTWSGGSGECTHDAARKKTRYDYSLASSPIQQGSGVGTDAQAAMYADVCPSCGAERVDQQIGLEDSVEGYVSRLGRVFDEVQRVLTPAGTLWLNLGDKIEDKELLGVPWLVAFELKRRGWILRRDIIWAKRNVMPESCKDRPTGAHEYIFLFAKQPTYFYNYEATLEPHTSSRWGGPIITQPPTTKYAGATNDGFSGAAEALSRPGREWNAYPAGGKNPRDVWEMATESLPDAHYAPYPQELVRRCITAGCPDGGTVLDPFLGSGTTAFVARKMHRKCIGIELSPSYCELIRTRTQQLSLFAEVKHG